MLLADLALPLFFGSLGSVGAAVDLIQLHLDRFGAVGPSDSRLPGGALVCAGCWCLLGVPLRCFCFGAFTNFIAGALFRLVIFRSRSICVLGFCMEPLKLCLEELLIELWQASNLEEAAVSVCELWLAVREVPQSQLAAPREAAAMTTELPEVPKVKDIANDWKQWESERPARV